VPRNQHSFAKRQREIAKKRKAEEKRLKRQKVPQGSDDSSGPEQTPPPEG